jgi:hypothetical protein
MEVPQWPQEFTKDRKKMDEQGVIYVSVIK